ncbi:MAG: non-heme iron oxygenase ferredoxin subunit [Candidatus Marsarchaeota archaeon]|nr:non-heme iron oxygenase ferredoxin subunit [Candidatus Marsarchaeota archaeon]
MFVEVCDLAQVRRDAINHFTVGGRELIVTWIDGEYSVLDGVCTHEYAELWNGFLGDGIITCPLHLSQFNAKTGEVLSPPAEEPLKTYRFKVEGSKLLVDLPDQT